MKKMLCFVACALCVSSVQPLWSAELSNDVSSRAVDAAGANLGEMAATPVSAHPKSDGMKAAEAEKAVVAPRKVMVDANFDGKVDRVEVYDKEGQILRVESDTDNDGNVDEWIEYEKGSPAKREKDSNGDGKPDVWIEY